MIGDPSGYYQKFGWKTGDKTMDTHGRRYRVRVDGVVVAICRTRGAALKMKRILEDVSEGYHERHAGIPAGSTGVPRPIRAGESVESAGPGYSPGDLALPAVEDIEP